MMAKNALSATNQQIIVAKFIVKHGSINRYQAEPEGVCHLAARIKELKYKGFLFKTIDEEVTDQHGITHQGIRRYWFDFRAMDSEQKALLNKLIGS